MKKNLLSILVLLYISSFCQAATNEIMIEPKDSLLMLLNRVQQDTARIRLLKQLAAATQNSPEENIKYSQELFILSKKNKNLEMQCWAIYNQMVSYSNMNDTTRFKECLQALKHYSNTEEYKNLYFQGIYMQIELDITYEEFEKARSQAFALLEEAKNEKNLIGELCAYQNLSHIYQCIGKTQKALEFLNKAYKLNQLPELKNKYPNLYDTLNMFIFLYDSMGDNKKCLFYLKKLEIATKEHLKKNPYKKRGYANILLYIEITYMACYIRQNDIEDAEKHIIEARKYLNKQTYESYHSDYHFWCHQYYKQKKEYEKALQELNLSISYTSGNDHKTKYLNNKADLLAEMGRMQEAILTYKTILNDMDSIHRTTIEKQSQQILDNYQIEKRKLAHIKTQNNIKRILLSVIIIACLLVFIALSRMLLVYHKLRKANKELDKAIESTQKANDEKNQYIASLHQCMRAPLSTVIGFSHALQEKELSEKNFQTYINIIQNNLEKLNIHVKDITKETKK